MASVIIWSLVFLAQISGFDPLTKNLLTFCATAPLVPLAFGISKVMSIDFQTKDNPLISLGILFSMNQMLYLLIAMWVYAAVPNKLVMVIAMIFGAHLLPYGWLYDSKAYTILSVFVSFLALALGLTQPAWVLALVMVVVEVVFVLLLLKKVAQLKA